MKPTDTGNSGCQTLSACPACDCRAHASLSLPGHWIGRDVFGDLQGKVGLARCRDCGLVFTNPRPSGERLNSYYSGNTYVCHETAGSASGGAKASFVLDRLFKLLPPGAPRSLLDYGAGGGAFLLHARAAGWNVQGFEPGRRGLETCRRLGLNVTGAADDLPSEKFGLVTLHHVLEHVPDPAQALRDIRRLMAPGGRLFIEVPNARSLRARLALPAFSRNCGVDERYRAFPIHLMYYNISTLRRMLAKGGWAVDSAFTIGLGADEFFTRPSEPDGKSKSPAQPTPPPRTAWRRLRHGLRDAFLGLGLGENLAVVARPIGVPTPSATQHGDRETIVTRVGRTSEVAHG